MNQWRMGALLVLTASCRPSAGAPTAAATASATATPTPTTTSGPPALPVSSAASADPLVGQPAPDFTATAQDGTTVHLAAMKGKPAVIYVYPKDNTPGCTKEACSFRDAWGALAKAGVVLVGVSADSLDSHKAFATHYKLPFRLISDPDGAIGRAYGVPFDTVHKRQTIVVGGDGRVRNVYRKVDVTIHARQIEDDLSRPEKSGGASP